MDNKKNFDNPVDMFFKTADTEPEAQEKSTEKQARSFILDKKEIKSIRTNLLMKPSLYKQIKDIAKQNKLSINETINQMLEQLLNNQP